MILQETIDNVLQIDIVSVISSYVDLKKSGVNYKGLSPFSSERTPSFMVSPQKNIFKCFSTGKGGNVVKFIMEIESKEFPEAVKHLASLYNIEIKETERSDEEKILDQQKQNLYLINIVATEFYKKNLDVTEAALNYMINERFISKEMIDLFDIGFASGTLSGFTNQILNNGYDWKMAVETSLLGYKDNKLYDRFRNRIMLPIKDFTGNIVGFGGRDLTGKKEVPKYLNSSDSIIYNKSKILYGIYYSKKYISEKNLCYLTEGYLDVVMLFQKGIKNVVSASGTAITSEQAKLIRKYAKYVTIIFDGDSAGKNSSLRGIDILLQEGLYVKVVTLPDGEDPDSFSRNKTTTEIENYFYSNSQDFIIFKIKTLTKGLDNDFALKINAINEVMLSISKINDIIQREIYIKEISLITDISETTLKEIVNQNKKIDSEISQIPIVIEQDFALQKLKYKENCEKKILQYLLTYGNFVLPFIDFYSDENGIISQIISEQKVSEYIKKHLLDDEIDFSSLVFDEILKKAIKFDLTDFNSLKNLVDPEMFLIADKLRQEEILTSKSNFLFVNNSVYTDIEQLILKNISKSIAELILYYKCYVAETNIANEMKNEVVDWEIIHSYYQFINSVKTLLNIV